MRPRIKCNVLLTLNDIMKKIRKVLEFILALLNFLFHFKPVPDETPPISPESFPLPDYQDLEKRNEPLFETVC